MGGNAAGAAGALDELAAVIGRPGALALAAVAGGGRCYIPLVPAADSWLVVLLGELQAGRLAARYGGTELCLPLPPVAEARLALVRELRAENYSIREIAARVNMHERSVLRLLAI